MAWKQIFAGATVTLMFGENWGKFVTGRILSLFVMVAWPVVITKFCSKDTDDAKKYDEGKKQENAASKKQKKANAG